MAKLTGTILMGGADAFVEASVITALEGNQQTAYRIREITWEIIAPAATTVFPSSANANQNFEFAVSRRTKAAMPDISDTDVFHKWTLASNIMTAAGSNFGVGGGSWTPQLEVLIVEDPIYVQLDSTATGYTYQLAFAIEYESQRISQLDRLTLLTQSL